MTTYKAEKPNQSVDCFNADHAFFKLCYNFRYYGDMPLILKLKQKLDNYAMDRKLHCSIFKCAGL